MTGKIYTELRIPHKSQKEKLKFELKLNKVLKEQCYNSRIEWIREKYRELIK
ncbi:hypothetical protein LGK95_13455 [Clostridium algoriphilum]|uniref:hypothetical protein n=1 Tax=Clostridium algoriphilum TaxID=198347 RepID=UPI001CF27D3E|nr:hypothetical protein [Clostridium algoriphilum]MCB2294515.1 hypothetical protein [Clostridium algoriphilum]